MLQFEKHSILSRDVQRDSQRQGLKIKKKASISTESVRCTKLMYSGMCVFTLLNVLLLEETTAVLIWLIKT